MLQGKKAYICSPLSAPNPEGVQHNMELAKYYLMQMKRLYHCRTFASHSHLPLMLDDRVPEERETAMQIGALMLDLCEVLIRFDTDPNNYLKDDYTVLLKTICNSLRNIFFSSVFSSCTFLPFK